MRHLRHWLAGGARPPEDAVVILAAAEFVPCPVAAMIKALSDGHLRVTAIIIAPNRNEAATLSGRFPQALVRVLPAAAPAGSSLGALRARAVVNIAPMRPKRALSRLMRAAKARGIPTYALKEQTLEEETPPSGFGPQSPRRPARAASREARLELRRGWDTGPVAPEPMQPEATAAFLAGATGAERSKRPLGERLAGHIARLGPARVTAGFCRRYESLAELRASLGEPETLLCLGNGPSSTAPCIASFPHDALFRVNLDWRRDKILTKPDLVFVGIKRAMRRLGSLPLAVATPEKEAALVACRLIEPWHGPLVYCVAEKIAGMQIPTVAGMQRPTTGAYMLAVASALAPPRLAIAGIDMFSHPDGAYTQATDPIAQGSINAFTASHGFETDAAFIAACLGQYEGELIVFSPALAALVRERCKSARFTLTDLS